MAVGTGRRESCRAAVRQTTRPPCRPRREQVLFTTVLAHGEDLCIGVLVVDRHLCFAAPGIGKTRCACRSNTHTLCAWRCTFNGTSVEQRSAKRPAFVHVNCDTHRIVNGKRLSVLQAQRQRRGRTRHGGTIEMTLSLSHSDAHRTDTRQRSRPTTHRAHIVAKTFQTLLLFLIARLLFAGGNVSRQ